MTVSIRQLAFLTLFYAATSHGVDPNDDDVQANKPEPNTATLQQSGGIKTVALPAAVQQPELVLQGQVVDLEPLLKLRQNYLAAQAQQDSAQARYQEADQNLTRTRNLHQQDIVSTRRLQEQQAQWRNDKANLASSGYQQQALISSSHLQWGELLTGWFSHQNHPQAQQFLTNRAQLLQISLPSNARLQAEQKTIWIDEQGRRQHAIAASVIAAAPQVDPITQGERIFCKLEGRKLPIGARLTAWLPDDGQATRGVIIPETAVVWHLGQAVVFIKTAEGKFEQRRLAEIIPSQNGYFANTGFTAGEDIVISGAQTLLSQELKNLIPSEDND